MPTCPYCREGHKPSEVLGWQFHQFSDFWVMCSNHTVRTNSPSSLVPDANLGKQGAVWPSTSRKISTAS
jgi:hypothetical protein